MDWNAFVQLITNPWTAGLVWTGDLVGDFLAGQIPDDVVTAIQNGANTLTGWLGTAYISIITGVINLFPQGGTFPSSFHSSASYFGNALASVNFIVPVGTLMTCITLVLGVKLALYSLHFMYMLVNFVRGVPTSPMSGGVSSGLGDFDPSSSVQRRM